MAKGFVGDPIEALRLMGLGFEASLIFSFWHGAPRDMPNFGLKIPKGLLVSRAKLARYGYIENASRLNLARYSYKTSIGNFLPFKAYERWKIGYDKHKAEFEIERDRYISEYDSLPQELRKESEEWITEIYKRVSMADKGTKPTLPFSENIISLLLSKTPKKRELAKFFNYRARLLPFVGLGESAFLGQIWPGSKEWEGVAKEGINIYLGIKEDIVDEFSKTIAVQYGQKCREMIQYLLEWVSARRASWVTMRSLKNALLDAEALNFFEDNEVSRLIAEAMKFLSKKKQKELESRLSDFLTYVNLVYSDR